MFQKRNCLHIKIKTYKYTKITNSLLDSKDKSFFRPVSSSVYDMI